MLGGCGCGPGSLAQRQTMKEWLTTKIQQSSLIEASEKEVGEIVDGWLDELPWGKNLGGNNLADSSGGGA